jgi:hypothetical protein
LALWINRLRSLRRGRPVWRFGKAFCIMRALVVCLVLGIATATAAQEAPKEQRDGGAAPKTETKGGGTGRGSWADEVSRSLSKPQGGAADKPPEGQRGR